MKKFFAIAAIALMCVPAFVSCKKDNKDNPASKNVFSIGDQEKTVVSAEYMDDDPNEYFLTIELEDETVFEFELSKANKGRKINLLEPDPISKAEITEAIDAVYYSIVVYKAGDLTSMHEIVNGNPKSTRPRTLGEGSYMQIDEEDGDIVLDFELRNCNFSTPFKANGITIAGHYKGFDSISEDAQ